MDHQINALRARYEKRVQERKINPSKAVYQMQQTYKDRFSGVIDAMAVACTVSNIFTPKGIDVSKLTPQMTEAFHLQYPNMTFEQLQHMSPEQLQGITNGWTGKLFEVIVRDKLNDGQWVGNIHLGAGMHAVLAQSATQPGWDLEIINHAGVPVDFLQMKATDSLSYIKSALEKYPEFHIVTTSEIFNNGNHVSDALMHHLNNSGISDDSLREAIDHILQHGTSFEENVAHLIPGLPFLIIALTEANSMRAGRKDWKEAIASSGNRATKSGIVMALVHGLEALGAGSGVTIPFSIIVRLGMTRSSLSKISVKSLRARNEQLRRWSHPRMVFNEIKS